MDKEILNWLQRQNAVIRELAMDEDFADINYAELIPVTTDGDEFAPAVAFISTDAVGQAEFINGNADDVPLADLSIGGSIAPVHMGAIGYGWGFEEINQARRAGIDLGARKAIAARRAYEEFMQETAMVGSAEKRITGLVNQVATGANATVTRGTDGTNWTTVTAQEALALVNKAIALTGVEGRPTADTVLLPYSLYLALASLVVDGGAMTGLEFVSRMNISAAQGRAVEILSVDGLETAAPSSKPRIIAYRRAPDVVELFLPMPHRFLDVYAAGPLRFEVPGVFRLAGVNVVRKRDFAYLDSTA